MRYLFFFLSSLCLVVVLSWSTMAEAQSRRPSSCQGQNCLLQPLTGSIQSAEFKPGLLPVLALQSDEEKMEQPFIFLQDTALEARPDKSQSKPGTDPALLGSGKVNIVLPDLATSPQLQSLAGKIDGLLQLAWWVLAIFGAGSAGQSGARVGSGLLSLLRALSANNQPIPSGQTVQLQAGKVAGPSSMSPPAS